jgi:acetylornithine/N-succinyldiaminopimelate aminotransferase
LERRDSLESGVSSVIWYPGYEVALKHVERAENCDLYDREGRRYVDLESGVWCTSIGHGNPGVLEVMRDQAARIAHTGFSFSNEIVEKAALEVLSLHGFEGGKCVFLCSGSEAVEFGVRAVQSAIERPLLLTMADSYFGAYGSAHRKAEDEWFCFDWSGCADCRRDGLCSDACEHWAGIPFERIGGFLFEPGSSSGLVRFPPDRLIQGIVSKVQGNDGLVLVNEVTTGFGRTGKWFGYQHYPVCPDAVAMGKGIGNGYPVSVTAFSPRAIRRLGERPIPYAQSHQNDPLGAAIALEVIRILREKGWIERGEEISALLLDGLENIKSRNPRIRAIRGRGLMVAVVLEDDENARFTKQVQQALVRQGFILAQRPGLNVLRIDPGLTVDRRDIGDFLEVFDRVLQEAGPGTGAV